MDFNFNWNRVFRALYLQRRVSEIRKTLGTLPANWTSVAWILLSIIFGIFAHQHSSHSSISSWIATHPPSQRLWSHLIGSNGFARMTKKDAIEKLYRSLPISMNDGNEIHMDEALNWIALSSSEFFCRNCEQKATRWVTEPNNWNSYQALETRLLNHSVSKKRPKVKENIDPREIRY
jgi:hypothetical protein